ncbi:THAP domain-containing protein 2-like isoform X1 [Spodoptera litura]|uniref:THAP domain-containing protein 2-like isoform X1 n=1 Tax=Spodoptera litura TaxID=69820 RepID=A0A9J7IT20_SPOLT|nr:THAP domain-containing protein 2-like isoform X1 [Spodoptera litura]
MPSCAVVSCRNRSQDKNCRSHGIGYHVFPKDPIIKEKWIEACGRKDSWFPTKNAVICSIHFTEECFQLTKIRRLFPNAIPTLKLRLVFDKPEESTDNVRVKRKTTNPNKMRTILEKYKMQIEKYKKVLTAKNLEVKSLKQTIRRCRHKINTMENILTTLKNENVIGEDHFYLMENDSITKFKVITPTT